MRLQPIISENLPDGNVKIAAEIMYAAAIHSGITASRPDFIPRAGSAHVMEEVVQGTRNGTGEVTIGIASFVRSLVIKI